MKNARVIMVLLLAGAGGGAAATVPAGEELERHFLTPPRDTGPEVWWHWLNGNISREGITRDLVELRDKGYRGATVFSLGHDVFKYYPTGPVRFRSPEWYELFRHAVSEAKRLGLKLAFHNCDGWATSGGPWVAPEDAMKELVFSEVEVEGVRPFQSPLPQPRTEGGYYRDIAVLAMPEAGPVSSWMREQGATYRASTASDYLPAMLDDNPTTFASLHRIRETKEVAVVVAFPAPVEVAQLFLYHTKIWGEAIALRCELFVQDPGGAYRSLRQFQHRQPWSLVEFPATKARQFKLVFQSFDNFSNYVGQQKLELRELQLLPKDRKPIFPLISDWDNQAGYTHFRVDDNYPPQGPVPADKVIPRDRQIVLTENFREGKLHWDVPPGHWRVIRLGYTLTGKPNEPSTVEGRGLECDKLSARSVEAFFAGFAANVLQQNRAALGEALQGILIDSWEAGNQNWTRDLPAEFARRRGYPLEPWLLVLTGRVVESVEATQRFLWDFRRTLGDLIAENYYGKMRTLCHQQGVKLQAEAAHAALQFMIDGINYHREVDIPMNEFWIEADGIGQRIRGGFSDAPSAAHLYDKRIVATESFTSAEGNWRHTPSWLKPAADKVFTLGINRITFDTYTHQPDERAPGWHMAPWGMAHNRKLTWWEWEKPWIDYLSRCQYLLQQGDHVADFLVFTGEGVPTFLPVAAGEEGNFVPRGYAFDGCNRETLLARLTVKDGRLVLPHGPSYRAIVLPNKIRMTPELAAGVARLVQAGATVFGPRPATSPSLQGFPGCDEKVRAAAALAWGDAPAKGQNVHAYGRGRTVAGATAAAMPAWLALSPDFEYKAGDPGARVEYIHKREGGSDFYFLSTQHATAAAALCTFRIGDRRPELWHPDGGRIDAKPNFRLREGRIELPIRFDPYGSVFVVFRTELTREERAAAEMRPAPEAPKEVSLAVIPVAGPWQVIFTAGLAAPKTVTWQELSSWTEQTEEELRHYSGSAVYTTTFNVDRASVSESASLRLDLGAVREIARVFVNGTEAEILWKPPYRADITRLVRFGENRLEVRVVNTWTNRMIGDLARPEAERRTWTNSYLPLQSTSPLMPSGLLGPVKIEVNRRADQSGTPKT
jgi:hypothetical protein